MFGLRIIILHCRLERVDAEVAHFLEDPEVYAEAIDGTYNVKLLGEKESDLEEIAPWQAALLPPLLPNIAVKSLWKNCDTSKMSRNIADITEILYKRRERPEQAKFFSSSNEHYEVINILV